MIAALLLGVSLTVSASPVAETGARQRAAELVRQLGNPSFKARQKASEELERLGGFALDAPPPPPTSMYTAVRAKLAMSASISRFCESFSTSGHVLPAAGGTKSTPPGFKGWQRPKRRSASQLPRSGPCVFSACSA